MQVLDYINRLLGRPPILPNGYPDVAATVTRRINGGQQQRWNAPGGFFIPPPPIPQQDYYLPTRSEPLKTPMVSEIVNKITTEPVRKTPSTTSSLSTEYLTNWCGTTSNYVVNQNNKKDPYLLDHLPLKRMLMKSFPWILDVTEVRVKKFHGTGGMGRFENGIPTGQLEIHITVSPIHHSELMNPKIEIEVRENLFLILMPLITCMFPNNSYQQPQIIFSPSHSESILEYVK